MQQDTPTHVTPARLKGERGWTDALIRDFLGAPDKQAVNPHARSAPPMRLYALERVAAAEETAAFVSARERAALRTARGRALADAKRQALIHTAQTMAITVHPLPLDTVRKNAIAAYNEWHQGDPWGAPCQPASPTSDPAFLARITVNYVRHRLTDYDRALAEQVGKVGVRAAAAIIRRRILVACAAAYPELATECARQNRERAAQTALVAPTPRGFPVSSWGTVNPAEIGGPPHQKER